MREEAASNKATVAADYGRGKNTGTLDRATDEIGDARQEMRELTSEIVRMSRP